jgi:hypothetical protein
VRISLAIITSKPASSPLLNFFRSSLIGSSNCSVISPRCSSCQMSSCKSQKIYCQLIEPANSLLSARTERSAPSFCKIKYKRFSCEMRRLWTGPTQNLSDDEKVRSYLKILRPNRSKKAGKRCCAWSACVRP